VVGADAGADKDVNRLRQICLTRSREAATKATKAMKAMKAKGQIFLRFFMVSCEASLPTAVEMQLQRPVYF
jgi:hypothetical protein